MPRYFWFCLMMVITPELWAQTVTVSVWSLDRENRPPVPSEAASVRIARAANSPPGSGQRPLRPQPSGQMNNDYSANTTELGSLLDVTIRQTEYHPWVVRDVYVGPSRHQQIDVQLFKLSYPIRAPQCFALKTQYELLFREEQRLNTNASRAEIEHRARLNYADGLLALPSSSRRDVQPEWVGRMLDEMQDEDRNELDNMVNDLYKLYRMHGFEQYTPSVWSAIYESPQGRVDNTVRLSGTQGTYTLAGGQQHLLTGVDIRYEEDPDSGGAFVISGTWKFNDSSGPFRWTVDEAEGTFSGYFQFEGQDRRYPWTGRREDHRFN